MNTKDYKLILEIRNNNYSHSEAHTDIYFYDLIGLVDKETSELLKLKHLDDLTIREISKLKDMSKSTVGYKLKKAYKKIYCKLSK